jgi:hypothetical protein
MTRGASLRPIMHRKWPRLTSGSVLLLGAAVIIVHHLDDSRSQRILWLLEELGLPYEIQQHKRDPETRLAPPELRQIHALG